MTEPTAPSVHIVDDDAALRRSMVFLAESVGWHVQAWEGPTAFLAAARPDMAGCLLLDVRMPGMSGLELHQALRARGVVLPTVFITAHGEVAMAVQAMKDGALDFIEKPYKDQQLLDAIAHAMRVGARSQAAALRQAEVASRYAALTPREREVAERVARGMASKLIARELAISDKTVQVHRAHIMEKMAVHSAAELAQLLLRMTPDAPNG